MKFLYKCDPIKNIECSKKACHIYDGPCDCTINIDYAKQPMVIKLIVPVDKGDLDDETTED